jgi:putative peptidoglycan lipid II flippase
MPEKIHKEHRRVAVNSSFWIILLTGISFAGFFIRDYLMAKIYGLGSQLDMFYLVTMIPMFMVTVFCVPFAQSVVPMLKKIQLHNKSQFDKKVRNLAYLIFLFCLFLCFVTYIFSDIIFYLISHLNGTRRITNIKFMQITTLPILLFSGLVILGNTILSLTGRYVYPALVQGIVPIFAIIFLLIFGKFLGVYSVILGMIFGQLSNLVVVNYLLKQEGTSLIPLKANKIIFKDYPFLKGYSYLVAASFLSSFIVPVNSLVASFLGEGSVAIYNLGTKLSLFVIGIFSSSFTFVLLPYLTKLANYKNPQVLKEETFYILFASSLFFILFSFLIFIYAEFISRIIFSYIVIENATILGLASVIKYSIIQLPFWVFNTIIFKHANAINKVGIILYTSISAFILNIILGTSLAKFMHIGGLALSSSISFAFSATIILIYYYFKKRLSFLHVFFIALLWFIFGATLIGMNVNPLLLLIEKLI